MAPGFREIRIEPALGDLREVSGSMPHPLGEIKVAYRLDKRGKGKVVISLPEGTKGLFVWKGKELPLSGGTQELEL